MSKSAVAAITAVTALVVAAFVFGDHLRTTTFASAQGLGFFGPFLVAVAAAVVAGFVAYVRSDRRAWAATGVLALFVVAWALPGVVRSGYLNARVAYTGSITFTDDPAPAFEERAPWRLANNLLRRNAENLRGEPADARYIIDGGVGRYTMLVNGDGATGRKTAGVVEWDGDGNRSSDFTTCRFDRGAVRSVNGIFWNDLARRINNTPGGAGLLFDSGDAYGVCVDGNARLYWPATDQVGYPATSRVFGGLVIIDHDGDIAFDRDVKVGEHPGPVYPISLAKAQQAAIRATGSFGDWHYNRANVAFDEDGVAGFGENPEDNPNTGNTGQFALATTDGRGVYATPLIPNKTSKMLSHLAVIEHDHARVGTVNDLVVHELEQRRKSNVEVSQIVKASFSNLPYASGIQIMEITPRDDRWVGTIGQQLVATYRFEIDADGEACLYDYGTTRLVRCTVDAAGENESGSETQPAGVVSDDEIAGLTDDELRDLRSQVDDEFDRRLTEAGSQAGSGEEGA